MEAENIMIKGIDHIELIVRDFNVYVAFMKTLGFEGVSHTAHHGQSVELKVPGFHSARASVPL